MNQMVETGSLATHKLIKILRLKPYFTFRIKAYIMCVAYELKIIYFIIKYNDVPEIGHLILHPLTAGNVRDVTLPLLHTVKKQGTRAGKLIIPCTLLSLEMA